MNCRHCQTSLRHVFVDLGFAPPSNAYLSSEDLTRAEMYFPLRLFVCDCCWLVQTEDYACAGDLFSSTYAYFSSTSSTWLDHAERYVTMICERLMLNADSFVIEVAANDGYLLRNFVSAGIPCLGIEPTASTAIAAEALGIPVLRKFFSQVLGQRLADQGKKADLIIGNNVYAHVPDINDFTRGLKAALKPHGVVTLEFPHLLQLIAHTQFDTVYHEHFSYLSLHVICRLFESAGLRVWDVEQLPTHGGSLRVYGVHSEDARQSLPTVASILADEAQRQLQDLTVYRDFQARADCIKNDLLAFLIEQKRQGKQVAGYGAAAKGNTLLNYAGVKPDLLPYVCDAALSKQGKYLPGSHIPILPPQVLKERQPDFILILPWNLTTEVVRNLMHVSHWGGRFVRPLPKLIVLDTKDY